MDTSPKRSKTGGSAPGSSGLAPRKRVPWWRRLEARVVVALVLMGVIAVGASGYLVSLTVRYFDEVGDRQARRAEEAVDQALPLYDALIAAKREAFDARTRALLLELRELAGPAERRERMERELSKRSDVHAISLSPGSLRSATATAPAIEVRATASDDQGRTLEVSYSVDPGVEQRFLELGQMRRELDVIEVEGGVVDRDALESAVSRAIAVASGAVLGLAILAGFVLARSMTRKVTRVTAVLHQVAAGKLDARAPPLGDDEMGQLAADLNRMLDELDQARERVAYLQRIGAWQEMARRIAHEIKNPLTPIQLAAQQLRNKDPGGNPEFTRLLGESVEIIEDEVDSLRRMVVSFSQFAKVPQVRLEEVEVARVLEEFRRAYGHLGDDEGEDHLDVRTVDSKLRVRADRQLLKQALVNLVENAVLSAREAGIERPRVCVRVALAEGDVVIHVEDNGPGVDLERREQIFEPYQTTREHGTGLGLAIVKKVVLDHAGEIWVDDADELGGARFSIRLPRLTP